MLLVTHDDHKQVAIVCSLGDVTDPRTDPQFSVHYEHSESLWEPERESDKLALHWLNDHLFITTTESHFCSFVHHFYQLRLSSLESEMQLQKSKMGNRYKRSDNQTGCKQTASSAKIIWKGKLKQRVKLLPQLSVLNIHYSLQNSFLVQLRPTSHSAACAMRKCYQYFWCALKLWNEPEKSFKGF